MSTCRTGEQGIIKTLKFVGETQNLQIKGGIFTKQADLDHIAINFLEICFYLKEYFVMDYNMVHHAYFKLSPYSIQIVHVIGSSS